MIDYGNNRVEQRPAVEAFRCLVNEIESWRVILDQLEAGHAIDRAEGNAALDRLLEMSQRLRDTILSIKSDAKWETKEELCELIARLDTSDNRKARYAVLARVLQAGTVLYRREKKRAERLQLRDEVVKELNAVYASASPPELPGPEVEAWLEWAWGLEDDAEELRTLQDQLPLLYHFVTQVEAELWQDGASPLLYAASISLEDANVSQSARELVESEAASDPAERIDTILQSTPLEQPQEEYHHSPAMEGEQDVLGTAGSYADHLRDPEGTESSDEVSLRAGLGSETLSAEASPAVQHSPSVEIRSSTMATFEASEIDTSRLVPFETFRAHHLLTSHGSVSESPWLHEGFRTQLNGLISESLSLTGLPILLLAVRAASDQGWPCLLSAEAVRQAACLVRTGKSLLTDQDGAIFINWRDALLTNPETQFEQDTIATHGVKLLSVVYAFSSNRPLNPSSLLGGPEAVQFTSPVLRSALEIFAQRALTTNKWVEHLQDRLDNNQNDRRQALNEKISAAKEKLRGAFREKTVLRGIERPHCREAWAVFIKKIDKERAALLFDAQSDWVLAPSTGEIERWATIYTRTMDAGAAKYKDRNKMDRAFQDLNDQANALAQLLQSWNSAPVASYHGDTDSAAIGQLHSLLASDPLADPEEELCRTIIRSVLRFQTIEMTPLELTLRDFLEHPQLLEILDELPNIEEDATEGWESRETIISIDNLREPVRVVARFMEGMVPKSEEVTDLLSSFREALRFCGRGDLQDRLIHLMDESEKRRLWSERRQEVELLQETANLISELGGQLSDFTDLHADQVRNYGSSLREISQTVGRAGFELLLMKAWSKGIADTSQGLITNHSESLRRRFVDNPAVLAALAVNDFGLATMLSGQGSSEIKRPRLRLRETTWRNESKALISDPQVWLAAIADQDIRELSYLEKAATNLAGVWLKTKLQTDTSAKKLRTTFLDYVFQTKRANSNLKALFIDKPTRHFINCQVLRSAIRDEGANPSYLPQLADIQNLAVVTPENISVSAIINSIKNLGDDLCVVLAPRVSEQVKRDVRQAAKAKLVAVIDNLDLCRLLELRTSTEVAPLLGLLEIALEQQSWDRVDPYRTQDGQHVRMEMFVGRAKEGEQLARTNDFKKLFSGRKLGKSALLRYVQDKFDHSDLPSGNELRVLYLPIVDHFRENDFVECLVTEIQDVCGWRFPAAQDNGWPRLHRVIRAFLEAHPKTSLLIVLDEADKFVEEELKSYLRIQEACLSFHLRSTIETAVDGRQLPRVRFLFAGYRTTNLSEGAWSNWGETLRLSPLDPTDATALLAGPLARVGVDLRELAGTVAYRCGYQPAVLLRAGKALLTRMAKQRQVDSWEYIQVRKQDTTAILEENQIRDEIRQVIDNNFTQNKLGEIVFHTSILLLSERQFGYALEDPEDQIMAALEKRDPKGKLNSWLKTDERSAKAKITEQLEELQQRRLLVSETTQGEPVRYRLAFPHHVSALGGLQQLSARLQQEIHDLPSGALNPVGNGTLCFFAADEVDSFGRDLKDSAQEPKEKRLVRALLAISHWLKPNNQNPALHPSCGMAAQIGYTGLGNGVSLSAEEAAEIISIENGLLLLTGGADLLRWGLSQVSEDYFHAIAPIRRFGPDELRAWFGVLYEIELTTRQVEGMHRLTGGIPMLVGELHRLILPSEDIPPPDKLDETVWSRVQTEFSHRLPSIARELRDGTADVRLTEREIEILRMVVIASDYANASTLSSDLTVGWDQFDRPDFKALSLDDEVSVTLLQDLGLIPMRRAFGLGPVQAITPIEQEDALRRMIDHL